MSTSRTLHAVAALTNGLALGAALLRYDRTAFALVALSILLLIRSLDRTRVSRARENLR